MHDLTTAIDLGEINCFANTAAALVARAVVYYGGALCYEAVIDLEFDNKLKPNNSDITAKLNAARSKIGKN